MKKYTISTLPAPHFLALLKLFESSARKEDRRDSVSAGEYHFSGSLDYSIALNVGEDNPNAVIAMSVPVWDILAAAIGRLNGVTVDALVRDVVDCKVALDSKAMKEQVDRAFKAMKEEARGLRRGSVKAVDLLIGD